MSPIRDPNPETPSWSEQMRRADLARRAEYDSQDAGDSTVWVSFTGIWRAAQRLFCRRKKK